MKTPKIKAHISMIAVGRRLRFAPVPDCDKAFPHECRVAVIRADALGYDAAVEKMAMAAFGQTAQGATWAARGRMEMALRSIGISRPT